MGLMDRIYEWQARRLETKIKQLEDLKAKLEAKHEGLIASGKVKPRLQETFKSMKEELKKEIIKEVLEKSDLSKEPKQEFFKDEPIRQLTSVKCRKVSDPYLYAETTQDEDVSLYNMNVRVYTKVDTRNPMQVLTRDGEVYAESLAPLRKDIYTHTKENPENQNEFNPYALGYGIDGLMAGRPLEYLEISRGDGSKFYIAERFERGAVGNQFGLREYSIKRYNRDSKRYEENIIFSEGIDLAKMISGDTNYTKMVGNLLLSENRLQKCLATPNEVRKNEQKDRILHGAGYVGHLEEVVREDGVKGYRKKSDLLAFDELQEARETQPIYQGTQSEICDENSILRRMHPGDYSHSTSKKENTKSLKKEGIEW